MHELKFLRKIDFRILPILFFLMSLSLCVISSTTQPSNPELEGVFFTPIVMKQLLWFVMGILVFIFFTCLDYRFFRQICIFLYIGTLLMLVGLFFTDPIQNVRRWYRVPFIHMELQPSEHAKLILVMTLSWFLEKYSQSSHRWWTVFLASLIVFIPFVLILKQPDLGTALVLLPVTLVMYYFGNIEKKIVTFMSIGALLGVMFVMSMFVGMISHEDLKPWALKFIKEYQYERLNPHTYHQQASQTAIALGGWTGSGFGESEFTGKQWLPFAHTDSIFPALVEQIGFLGGFFTLSLYFFLIYLSFQVSAVAKDAFGKLLSSGITVYLAMHVVVNIGMMCGLLPITGVPLILLSYGGSSVLATMAALGILQSIYVRRFMFS